MARKRLERDLLGEIEIDADSLAGISTVRARENFGLVGGPVHERLLRAYGIVKLACARVNRELGYLDELLFATRRLRTHCVAGLRANEARCRASVNGSTAVITAFVDRIGYEKAWQVAERSRAGGRTIREILLEEGLCSQEEYEAATSAETVLALGFRDRTPVTPTRGG